MRILIGLLTLVVLSGGAELRTTGDTRAFWELRERAAP